MDSEFDKVELNQKEKTIEGIVLSIAILLLLGCFMKVLFF